MHTSKIVVLKGKHTHIEQDRLKHSYNLCVLMSKEFHSKSQCVSLRPNIIMASHNLCISSIENMERVFFMFGHVKVVSYEVKQSNYSSDNVHFQGHSQEFL